MRGSLCLFSRHNADKYGYLGYFWWSLCATNKFDYFSIQRVISHRVWLSLIVYSSTSQKKCLQIPCIFLSLMSLSEVFISFAKNGAIDFCYFFSRLLRILFSLKLWNKKWGSLCSFKRKGAFISLYSLVWGKSLMFCTRMCSWRENCA